MWKKAFYFLCLICLIDFFVWGTVFKLYEPSEAEWYFYDHNHLNDPFVLETKERILAKSEISSFVFNSIGCVVQALMYGLIAFIAHGYYKSDKDALKTYLLTMIALGYVAKDLFIDEIISRNNLIIDWTDYAWLVPSILITRYEYRNKLKRLNF